MILFNELALLITKTNGIVGFIQPNKFLSAEYGFKILNLIVNNSNMLKIYDVSLDKVFSEASVYPYIFIYQKTRFSKDFQDKNVNLFEHCKDEDLKGFDKLIKSKNIIRKIELKSKKIHELTNSIKRGVPNSKIEFIEQSELVGIKSTLLEYSYFLPKSEVFIKYLEDKDLKSKLIEFENELVLLPRTTLKIRAVLKNENYHILDRIYYFKVDKNIEYSNKYILSILNSKITTYYYDNIYGSTKIGGGYIDLKGSQIENFLIPKCSTKHQQPFIEKADAMILLYKTLQQQQSKVINMLQRDYDLEKPTKKLETWYELSLQSFFAELTKAKIVLSAIQKDEVQEYFETYQKQAVATKNQIIATDKQIDTMVYELYGLSNEEIEIVENS